MGSQMWSRSMTSTLQTPSMAFSSSPQFGLPSLTPPSKRQGLLLPSGLCTSSTHVGRTRSLGKSLFTNAIWKNVPEKLVSCDPLFSFSTGNGRLRSSKWVYRSAVSDSSYGEGKIDGSKVVASEPEPAEKKLGIVQLGTYFGFWFFYNVVFNIYNKKTLNVFSYPWFLATYQLFAGAVWMLGLWTLRLQPYTPPTKEFFKALLLPAFFHAVGHIAACVSFSKVAISFTHVIKSAEPVFAVLFSSLLGDSYSIYVWLSLIPIVAGCSLASLTEVTFNFGGLWSAMLSNVGFVLRNIYSKRSLKNFKQYDGINLYGWISIVSFFYLLPFALYVEGPLILPGFKQAIATVGDAQTFAIWFAISGIFYHLYNQSSYQALDGITPLTFSVGNTMKRVVVIIASVIAFRNPIRPLNGVGSAIAILGTFLYSQAQQKAKEAPKAA